MYALFSTVFAFSQDSMWVYMPSRIDSTNLEACVPKRCKNDLSDSLIAIVDSLKNKTVVNTLEFIDDYSYQFTQTFTYESDFQNKLVQNDMCFSIEELKDLLALKNSTEFILYDENWVVVVALVFSRIGNSTYWSNAYFYFKIDKE